MQGLLTELEAKGVKFQNNIDLGGSFLGQWGVGLVIDRWPQSATGYDPQAYTYAFGALWVAMLVGLAWLWSGRRLFAGA